MPRCGLEQGIFHRCPQCSHLVEAPATGSADDDLCAYCQQLVYREKMLQAGAWHRCPDDAVHIVESPDPEEPCALCRQRREWKRRREEAERERQAKIEQERKERRRAYAKVYRKRRKERDEKNRRGAEQGLPPLEVQKPRPVEDIILHRGHRFRRQKDQHGRPEVYCLVCEAAWSKPPLASCAGIKTYRAWRHP